MENFIVLLRGINVSGQKKIKMADLRKLLGENGFPGVQTYIQSGNIILESTADPKKVGEKVSALIRKQYDFEVPALVRRPSDFEKLIQENPFAKDPENDPKCFYVTFLDDKPTQELVDRLKEESHPPEEWEIDGKDIYFHSPKGYGRAKMNNNYFERKLKTGATTRNWRSIHVLLDMCKAAD
ncbi:MAG: DUF1697 domain-containing protein [Bacteroidetes bacterium]|nr:DUF1697 domain-containing protein [Bacteroidota bacterium]